MFHVKQFRNYEKVLGLLTTNWLPSHLSPRTAGGNKDEVRVWLNYIVVFVAVIVIALWTWWLFRPQPMPLVLQAKWTVRQGFVHGKPAFSPKGDLLATSVFSFAQGGTTLSVNFWYVPKGSQAKPTILVSKRSQFPVFTPQPIAFSPDGSLLAVGYLEQGVGKISVFRVTDNRLVRTITIRESVFGTVRPLFA